MLHKKSGKSKLGQIELLPSLLLVALISTTVLAANITNSTSTTEKSALIEVWANTSISLQVSQNTAIALLSMDNSSAVESQKIGFFLNSSPYSSAQTDSSGFANTALPYGFWMMKAVFEGNSSLFLNPSEAEMEVNIENITQENNTTPEQPASLTNQSILTIFTNKTNYTQNETVNVFGEIIINGTGADAEISLSVNYNDTAIHSAKINSTGGAYSHSLGGFENEGQYLITLSVENLTNSTIFYYSFENITQNLTQNLTQNITQNISQIMPEIIASVFIENVTQGGYLQKLVTINGSVFANGTKINSTVAVSITNPKGKIEFSGTVSSSDFSFSFLPKLSGQYATEILAQTTFGDANKTLMFDILKHKTVKAKIKQPKWNYAIGEKIKFEIDVIDEDGSLYTNATVQVFVTDPEGNVTEVNFTEYENEKGKYFVVLDTEREFRPGVHKLKIRLSYISPNPGEVVVEEEITFAVGLININTPKSIYLPGENATIIVGVLDEIGKRVTDADVALTISSPSGNSVIYSTQNGLVKNNGDGTYTSYYATNETGNYTVYALAQSENVSADYTTYFEVRNFVEFDIERKLPVLVDILAQQQAEIKFKSSVDAENVTIVEKIPKDFFEVIAYGGRVEKKENETWIIWKFDKLSSGEEKTLTYQFTPPDIKPIIYLIGPIYVHYNNSLSFKETRGWTVIVVDVVFYFFDWLPYDSRDNVTATHPLALCAGGNYSIRTIVTDPADDEGSGNFNWDLQVLVGGVYYSLPYTAGDWLLQAGETNPHNPGGNILGIAESCAIGSATADKCEWGANFIWNISIGSSVQPGDYKLRIYPAGKPTGPLFKTNILDIRVLDCNNINLFRPVNVFSPSGEPNKVIKGYMATIALPLANYNSTAISNINATLEIFDGATKLSWFIEEGGNIDIGTIAGSPSPPLLSNKTIQWHVTVPDDIDGAKTYTARVTVNYPGGQRVVERTFTVYQFEGGTATDVTLYHATTRMIGAKSTSYFFRNVSVCNYGDYNLTVNVTDFNMFNDVPAGGTAPSADEDTTPTTGGGYVRWWNRLINTSTCFSANIRYVPGGDSGEERFTLQSIWTDPVTGLTRTLEKEHVTLTVAVTKTMATEVPRFNITSIAANSSSVAVKFGYVAGGSTGLQIHSINLFIPPGFDKPRGFTRLPDTGYPIGSVEEGWIVKWSLYRAGGIICTSATAGAAFCDTDFVIDVANISYFPPGPRAFEIRTLGYGVATRGYVYHTDLIPINVLGPWPKTVRYYNNTATSWTEGFPTSFACGVFNTSLQVFNKGNVPLLNSNITENKDNVTGTVTHPVDLIFQNNWSLPSVGATIESGKKVTWGTDNINFVTTGKDNAGLYNYTINVTYQTNGTFRFQAIPLNGTSGYRFYDENYTMSVACGAQLSVSQPTSEGSLAPSTPFNVSSTVSNAGPGNATNVLAIINVSAPASAQVEIRNSTGQISNVTYLGTLSALGSSIARYNITSNSTGDHTFCIRANASENATEVASCNTINIPAPAAQILLETPLTISNQTGGSTGAWGFNFTFNISVKVTNSNNDVSVCSYFSATGSEPWRQVNACRTYPAPGGGSGPQRNYTYSFDAACGDIGATVYAKFNATNNAGTSNSTSSTFSITKENVTYEYYIGQGSTANRTGNQTTMLSFRVRDINGTLLPGFGTKYYITTNNVTYFSDSNFVINTNSSAYANLYFNATCSGEYSGAPKFLVSEQQWKITVDDAELSCYNQNDSSSAISRNLFVWGDIRPTLTKPKLHTDPVGGKNFTQEESIDYLGFTVDDCSDSLTLNESAASKEVKYFINQTTVAGYNCTESIELVGSNAYSCTMATTIQTQKGWYNSTFYVNKSYHYANYTLKYSAPGLFYINPVRKLQSPSGLPATQGWGYQNFNFSVIASSGDPDVTYNVSLMMSKIPPPSEVNKCEPPLCQNQTIIECKYPDCVNAIKFWYRNFSAANFSESATWYYRYFIGADSPYTFEAGTHKVTLTKDNASVEYGSGNNSVARYDPPNSSAELVLRVRDLTRNDWASPAAYVNLEVTTDSANSVWKFIGTNTTNTTSHVAFYFTPDCSFANGTRLWRGKINTTLDTYYDYNISSNFNVQVLTETCVANIYIQDVKKPAEIFQNRSFGVNATIQASQGDAENTNATIVVPSGWDVWNGTAWSNVAYLGTISSGSTKDAHWEVKPNSSGSYTLTIYANATMGGSPKSAQTSAAANPYKWLQPLAQSEPTLPKNLTAGESSILAFNCEAGTYRLANLTISSTNMTSAPRDVLLRAEVYNSTEWKDILHSYKINLTGSRNDFVPVLQNQLFANESGSAASGYCRFRISNVGNSPINITGLTLQGYYTEGLLVQDIQAKTGETVTTGLEQSETLFNVTVRTVNSNATAVSGVLWLNITNSSGYLVNYSSQSVYIAGDNYNLTNFTNINTTLWAADTYTLRAYLTYGSSSAERSEPLIFKNVSVSSRSAALMCNRTTEIYNVTIVHPFSDSVQYNVTLQNASGWTYYPLYQLVNATSAGNYTVSFNLTSSNAASETVIINASVNYTYPGIGKRKNASYSIEESNSLPIMEVIRETPRLMGKNKVFESQLSIHNKGCAASSATVQESLSTGWTPANPSIKDNEYTADYGRPVALSSASTDLEANTILWTLGSIAVNKYAVLTYQIKSPDSTAFEGSLRYNASWGTRNLTEDSAYKIQTLNYTSEPHLEFDIEALQQSAFPWAEPRSIQPNRTYNYSVKVTNIGDTSTGTEWNVSLTLTGTCNATQVFNSGTWNESARKILWSLPNLGTDAATRTAYLNFSANCTSVGRQTFLAEGLRNTTNQTMFVNDTNIGCNGSGCSTIQSYTFTKPSGARYEKMSEIDFYVTYNWTDYNVTIGQGFVNFTDDTGKYNLAWQNYSFDKTKSSLWGNYSIDDSEQSKFISASRNIGVNSFVDATSSPQGNVTVERLAYTWKTGRAFSEQQELFTKTKVYTYTPLMQNATLYIKGNSSSTVGGWGEEFNFSLQVRDRFGRDVTVYAWHKNASAGADWMQFGTWTCSACSAWTQRNFTYDYNQNNIQSWQFKFNATNADGSAELSGSSYTVEKDDINIANITPSPDVIVNRSISTVFSTRAYDRDNSTYPTGSSGKIWLDAFTYGSFESSPPSITSSNGWINRTMDGGAGSDKNVYWCSDTSKWYLGLHSWYGGTSGDSYVKDNTTAATNFTLKADIANSTMQSFSSNYTRGDVISFSGSAIDDCSVTQTDAAKFGIEFRMIKDGVIRGSCNTTSSFSCSITTDATFPYGWYNITAISFARGSDAGNYWNGTRTQQSAFFLRSQLLLEDAKKSPAGNPAWGQSPFNFSVNITSADNEPITTYLWMSNSSGAWWIENQTTCSNCNNYYFFTSKSFNNNSIPGNVWYWKFNASSPTGYSNGSLATNQFNVTKDTIDLRNFGNNNTNINRSSGITAVNLTARLWDLILNQNTLAGNTPNVSLAEIHFWIYNGTAYAENNTEESRNDTDYWRQFNPDCTYLPGQRSLVINVTGAQAYFDNSTEFYTGLAVNIFGDNNATYVSPSGNEYERDSSITFSGNVTDDCSIEVTSATVRFNLTSGSNVYTCDSSSTANPYTCIRSTSDMAVGNYTVTMTAYKSYYNNGTDFEQNAFKVKSTPSLKAANVSIRTEGWAPKLVRNFTVNVTDNTGDTVTVYLWQRHSALTSNVWQQIGSSQQCTSCSNTTIWWNKSFASTDVSTTAWEFKFNSSDTEGNSYTTTVASGDYISNDNTFTIEKDNVLIEYSAGNETVVTLENSTQLTLRVYDIDNQTYVSSPSASVSYNITKQGIGSAYNTTTTVSTNATGHSVFAFTPDQTFAVTKQSWKGFIGTDSAYKSNESGVFNVTTLTNVPRLDNESVTPQSGGWGDRRRFNVTVYDQNNTATVYLWRSSALTGPWTLISQQSYTTVNQWQTLSYLIDFACSDIGTWYFKFNATNAVGNKNSTLAVAQNNFTMAQDIITFEEVYGNNSIANRSLEQKNLLRLRVRDANGTAIPDLPVKFYTTLSGSTFDAGTTNNTNSSGYSHYYFNPGCSPKYVVGDRMWYAEVSGQTCYKNNNTFGSVSGSVNYSLNLSVQGDITLNYDEPLAGNYKQEETISFLGSVVDDCSDVISPSPTVRYFANHSTPANTYECTPVTTIGANAYTCKWYTNLSSTKGYYNATMLVNATNHYTNKTFRTGSPGLFQILTKQKLANESGLPSVEGWGYKNWNFSVIASSGDPDTLYNVSLWMTLGSPTFATKCESPTCVNQTSTYCTYPACINTTKFWYRNFTASQQGLWYYQYQIDTSPVTATSAAFVTVEKDDINVSYGGLGNASTATYGQPPTNLSVRLYDFDVGTYNLDPNATVSFKLYHTGYAGGYKLVGSNQTNSTGFANFWLNVSSCSGWVAGAQNWAGEVNSSEANYKPNASANFTITIALPGCEAAVDVTEVITPKETFVYRNFTVNATVTSWVSDSNNVYITLNLPAGWIVDNPTKSLGTVQANSYQRVSWDVNATSYGVFNVSAYANSSNAGNDSASSGKFNVYKQKAAASPLDSLPKSVLSGQSSTFSWSCEAGQYRIANLTATWDGNNTRARIYVFNNSDWKDVLHSYWMNTSGSYQSQFIPVLQNQMQPNASNYCLIKIENIGANQINITGLLLSDYHNETVLVQDIIPRILGTEVYGAEPGDALLNVTVRLANSNSTAFSGTIWLNITNSSGYLVNYSSQQVNIPGNSYNISNFTQINTTLWMQDTHTLRAYLTYGSSSAERSEQFVFKTVAVSSKAPQWMCNVTTEVYNVSIYHPFTDTVQYNVTLRNASGWTYSPFYQLVNASAAGNYSAAFNLTSSNAASETVIINATVNYTYPTAKSRNSTYTILENNSIAILEVVRETPAEVANSTEFFSRLIVHNKGCGATSSASLTEKVSSGWTAYSPAADGSAKGDADIPAGEVRFSSSDFGTIGIGEYRILLYKMFSPSQIYQTGNLRYNLTWDSRNLYEESAFTIKTMRYVNEQHISFDLTSEGGYKRRSAQPAANQTYNLTVKNTGDMSISANAWNVSLLIPTGCVVSNYTGTWNDTSRKIAWQLGSLQKGAETNFSFVMNCTAEAKYLLTAEAINDTRTQTVLVNNTNIPCTGATCSNVTSYSFTKPTGARYEKMSEIDFYVSQDFTAQNLTIADAQINISDDFGRQSPAWQNYTLRAGSSKVWSNYSLDEAVQDNFTAASRNIGLSAYADATSNPQANVTIERLSYIWKTGKAFSDSQPLFVRIKTFVFTPDPPVLQSPPNDSTQVSSPIVISWFPSTGATNYYVFGDAANGTTYLANVTVTNYLWSLTDNGLYKWKVIAAAGAQNSTASAMWQFTLDQCGADPNYAYALNYPMSYNNTTDTIAVWGSDGSDGYTAMGNNQSNPITFEKIFEFGKAKRGICAIIKPATGIYVMKSRLFIGNATKPTYVVSKGESISFTSLNMSQLTVNTSANIIFGSTADGVPQEGSNVKFTSSAFDDKLLDVSGGSISFYDSYVTDSGTNWGRFVYTGACGSGENYTASNSSITIKKTIFDRAARGHFFYTNNASIDDMKINRINSSAAQGYGIVAACNIPAMNNLQIYHQEQNGSAIATTENMPNSTDITVQNSVLDFNAKDVIATGNGRGLQLINTQWDRTYGWNFNNTNGNLNGTVSIKESYGYLPTFVDTSNVPVANLSLIMLDVFGTKQYNFTSNASGAIGEQFIKTWQVEKSTAGETVTSFNPYTNYFKKYGKAFIKELKSFTVRTVETKQIATNTFVTKTEAQAGALADITYNEPAKISYGGESNSSWQTSGQLKSSPVDQCQYFALFANGTKLDESINYTMNYASGAITFLQNVSGYTINPVYYYGGNVTVTNGGNLSAAYTMKDIYDYMQYKSVRNELFEDLYTVDGVTYTFCVNFVIGNSTRQGTISDADSKIAFKHSGYTISFSGAGGFVDLAGITAAGGAGGGLPLNIFDDVGSSYKPGETVYVFSTTLDSSGNLVSATVNVTIYYPNGTALTTGLSSQVSIGRFTFNYTLPASAPDGTYRVDISASYSGNNVYDNLAFIVSSGAAAYPTIELSASSPIATLTTANIGALVKTSAGIAANCDGNLAITIRNLADGSATQGTMTNFGTGMYNFSWSTPASANVFYVNASCSISGTKYTGFTLLSTQPTGATASVDYNQIAVYVWNYNYRNLTWWNTTGIAGDVWNNPIRNLTYYNQSVAESLENCLKSGACAGWWINTTLAQLNSTVNLINTSSNNIYNDTQWLRSAFNCTVGSEVCSRLQNILNNVTDTQARVYSLNTSQIPAIQLDTDSIQSDTAWLRSSQNCTAPAGNTTVCSNLWNIMDNSTYIKNNMFYQANATSAFIVKPLATVYTEPASRAELFVLTSDLLGNQKTVSASSCNVTRRSEFVSVANSSNYLGYVYAFWTVPAAQPAGEYSWNCTLTGSSVSIGVPFYVANTSQILAQQYEITMSDFVEVLAGKDYMARIWIKDYMGRPANADSLPKITLYDPTRQPYVENISMIWEETGVYRYNKTIPSTQATFGVWEAVVYTTVNGVTTQRNDYWELEGAPAEVKINSITDNTVPTITASVTVTNEGSVGAEYPYEYCIVAEQTNPCGGGDDQAYASGAKYIDAGQAWNTQLTLSVSSTGNYWFKMVIYWGTERSGASRSFTAIEEAAPPAPAPAVGVAPAPPLGKINISEYPKEMRTEQGSIEFYAVKIKNIGSGRLNNITLSIDLPVWMYSIAPDSISEILPGNENAFVIKIKAPLDAELKTYAYRIKAKSNEDEQSAYGTLEIIERNITVPFMIFDVQISTARLYLNAEGKIDAFIENIGEKELKVTGKLLLPKGWIAKESEVIKMVSAKSNTSIEFTIIPTTFGLNNITLEMNYDGQKVLKNILVNVEVPLKVPEIAVPWEWVAALILAVVAGIIIIKKREERIYRSELRDIKKHITKEKPVSASIREDIE